tara:strand:+ start:7816 stop:11718 length:3903 start_codon:yes stop_codon:yes gene_type:complete
MNGIISLYSEDIAVNKIDANEIIVDDLTINNSLEVNNITLSPETISFLDGATSNIQTQIDTISNVQGDYVTLDTTQQITGAKEFLNTTTLTGDLDVNNVSITPTELSYLDGVTSNIQDQINNSVVGMTLNTDQTATGFKIFENGINTPFIQNSDQSGFINGFLKNLTTILYSSLDGVYAIGSIVSGGNVTNKELISLNLNTYEATIETNDELQAIKLTTKGYIPSTDNFLLKNITNVQVLNGIVFNTTEDIIDTLVNNQITLQYNTGFQPTITSIVGTIIQIATNYYLITNDSINVFDFIECSDTFPLTETILNPAPNQYLLSYPSLPPTINSLYLSTSDITTYYPNTLVFDIASSLFGSRTPQVSDFIYFDLFINGLHQFYWTSITNVVLDVILGVDTYVITTNTQYSSEEPTTVTVNFYPPPIPTESTNVTINNFNYNNKLFTDSIAIDYSGKYAVDNLNIPYGSKLTSSSDNSVYTFSINPSNQISIDDVYGFYDGGLYIFETTDITNPSTQSLLLQNTEDHGFISSISANNEIVLSYDNFQTTTSTTIKSYVKDVTGNPFMIIGTNKTDSYSNNSSISLIGSNLGGFSYGITSPNTIVADTPTTISVKYYLPNSTTILFQFATSFVVGDFYEIGANYGYQITGITANNFIYTTTTNTNVNTSRTITGSVVENFDNIGNPDGTYSFLYGNGTTPILNSPIINSVQAQQNNICYISANTESNQINSFGFEQTRNPVILQTPIEFKAYTYVVDGEGLYVFNSDNTSSIQINDIVHYKSDDNNTRTGRHITSIKQNGNINSTNLKRYGGLYSESASTAYKSFSSSSTYDLRYAKNTSTGLLYFSISKSAFSSGARTPQVNDFIYFDLFDIREYSWTYITAVTDGAFNNYILSVNFQYDQSPYLWNNIPAYFYEPKQYSFGLFSLDKRYNIYRPLTYDEYTFNTTIDKYAQTNKFYTSQTYNLFNNTTTKIYDEIAINEFPAIDFNIYQNYQFNFQTTKNISLPSVGQNDTFVTRRFQQTLTNKKIGDDLIVDGRITLTGENDPSTLLCKISPFGFGGGDIIAENNLSCSGILDCSNNAVEHKIGDLAIGNISGYGVGYQGLSHIDMLGQSNSYALFQQNTGGTFLNSPTGTEIKIRNNNQNKIVIGDTYSTIYNDLVLQRGYIDLYFKNGQSLPNGSIQDIQFGFFSTLPTGFEKNNVGGGYSTTLKNNSGRTRTLVMGGSLSINGGTSGFLMVYLAIGTSRLFTFLAPLANGSATVTLSFTYKISNGTTVNLKCYQNSGATRLVESNANRRGRLFGQVL